MAEPKSALAILSALRPQRATLRRELARHAEQRGGMSVGFPRTEVLDFHIERILDALDQCEATIEIARDAIESARSHSGGCEDWCERPRGRGCWYCTVGSALEVISDG